MTGYINIFNPNDKPYGQLSNNYVYDIRISKEKTGGFIGPRERKTNMEILLRKEEQNILTLKQKKELREERYNQYADTWKSVTNFVYANYLNEFVSQNLVKAVEPSKVIKEFKRLYQKEINNVTKKAATTAYEAKLSTDADFKQSLLDTGNSYILYIDSNLFLGLNYREIILNDLENIKPTTILEESVKVYMKDILKNNMLQNPQIHNKLYGENTIGKILMQLRHNLQILSDEKRFQKNEQLIYNTYLAQKGLANAIFSSENTQKFIKKTYQQIIDMTGGSDLIKSAPKSQVFDMIKQGKLNHLISEINDPSLMLKRLRSEFQEKQINEIKDIVFNLYCDYLLEKNYPNVLEVEYSKAKKQQIAKLSYLEKNRMQNELYGMYKEGYLSERLSTKIDREIGEKLKQIISIENDDVDYPPFPEVEKIADTSSLPLIVLASEDFTNRFYRLLPKSLLIFNVDGLNFPTVSHFILYQLLTHIGSEKIIPHESETFLESYNTPLVQALIYENPYKFFLTGNNSKSWTDFNSLDNISEKYNLKNNLVFIKRITGYASIALEQKFKDKNLQDILLSTGDARILYSDISDNVLGTGIDKKQGINYTGKKLVEMRSRIYEERRVEGNIELLTENNISDLLNKNQTLRKWLQMRVQDICNLVNNMRKYEKEKYEKDIVISAKFTENCIDNIYHTCSAIYSNAKKIAFPPTEYFKDLVKGCSGFGRNINEEVIDVIWKHIAVFIYYMIIVLNKNQQINIIDMITSNQYILTQKNKCIYILDDKIDSCIASALINVMYYIIRFNRSQNNNDQPVLLDVKLAASIILNNEDIDRKTKDIEKESENVGKFFDETEEETQAEFMDKLTRELQEEEEEQEFLEGGLEEEEEIGEEQEYEGEGGYSPLKLPKRLAKKLKTQDTSKKPDTKTEENIAYIEEILVEHIGQWQNTYELSQEILKYINIIKKYNLDPKIKNNRINFFATIAER